MGARAGRYKFGARAGKHRVGARASKYKFEARAGKHKVGARAGKYKFRARAGGQAKGQGLGNTNTQKNINFFLYLSVANKLIICSYSVTSKKTDETVLMVCKGNSTFDEIFKIHT